MKVYALILTVDGLFMPPVHVFKTREAAVASSPALIRNGRAEGYSNQFGDYYTDEEDFSYYICEAELDAPVIPAAPEEEEE